MEYVLVGALMLLGLLKGALLGAAWVVGQVQDALR